MTQVLNISGLLSLHSDGDSYEVLYVSSLLKPLADELECEIDGKQVSVRYWITDKPCTKEEAGMEFLKLISGAAKCDYGACYSEYTGYLWTDEDLIIEGHDLMAELKSNVGKWLNLEITIHGKKAGK